MKKLTQFRIFADVPPMHDNVRLAKYKEAGFTHYIMTEDYIDFRDQSGDNINVEYIAAVDRVLRAGLKVLIRAHGEKNLHYFDGITTELYGKTDGFYMCDEPSYHKLDWGYENPAVSELKSLVEWYNAYGGDTFFHINLLQSYGIEMLHGSDYTFPHYVEYYIKTILENVNGAKSLSTDFYPLAIDKSGNNYIKEFYLYDYFIIAANSKALREKGHDIQTCFCIQVFSEQGLKLRPITSAADIRFQTNIAAAFGAKNLEYFPYVSFIAGGDGILPDMENQLIYDPVYYYVKKVNAEMQTHAKLILSFEWNGARVYTGTIHSNANSILAFAHVSRMQIKNFSALSNFTCTADTVISEFVKENNYAYLLVNYSEPSLGKANTVTFRHGKNKTSTVTLGPGEAVFISADNIILMNK